MHETTFEVRVPMNLLEFGFDQDKIQHQINQWLVFSLFTDGRVSSGRAAALLGMTRADFLALLRQRGIAFIDYTPEELAEEFEAVTALKIKTVT